MLSSCTQNNLLGITNESKKEEVTFSSSSGTNTKPNNELYDTLNRIFLQTNDLSVFKISTDNEAFEDFIVRAKEWQSSWADGLWLVRFEREKIVRKDEIRSKADIIDKFDYINISQGSFIEIFNSSHQGNGSTILVSQDNLTTPKYEFSVNTVDRHWEGQSRLIAEDDPNFPELIKGKEYMFNYVYVGDMLESKYVDVNNDGYTDVIFSGYQELHINDMPLIDFEITQPPNHLFYVKWVYLYDKLEDNFMLSDELSEEIKLF